ncbi:MAG: hypothetical protein QG670_539 [Thermoproteota archaeon]|nr:hypothetical protein [Thermoproteota archaeon]
MWKIIRSKDVSFSPYPKSTASIKRILEQKTLGSKRLGGLGIIEVPPNGVFPEHTHPEREEVYYVLSGSGSILIEGKEVEAEEGLTFYVSGENPHGIKNAGRETLWILFVTVYV